MSLDFISAQRAVDNLRSQRAPGDPVALPGGRIFRFVSIALHSETLAPLAILVDPEDGTWIVAAPGAVRDSADADLPQPASLSEFVDGRVWRHRKGGVYTQIGTGRDKDGPVVIYAAHADRLWWVRPASMFSDGRFSAASEPPLTSDELGL